MTSYLPLTPTSFGKPMRKHFCFAPEWANLNHGSYGTYPKYVQTRLRECQDMGEARPDKFLRWDNPVLLDESRALVAETLNVPVEETVFVQNSTTGVNTVLRNLVWEEGDAIVFVDTIYGGCEKTILSLQETNPQLSAFRVDYTLPCSHGTIVRNFQQTVKDVRAKGLKPKLAMYDTVVSMPGVRFPFERLTVECRKEGIISLIDGAHGIGHIPLDLAKLDADFFVSNCHKWFFTPRGCAVFHVPVRNHHLLRTTYPTSHGYVPSASVVAKNGGKPVRKVLPPSTGSAFVELFQLVATVDPTPFHTLRAAQTFRRTTCGSSGSSGSSDHEARITTYIRDIAQRGADLLAQRWGTSVMDDRDCSVSESESESEDGEDVKPGPWGRLRDCAMANVRIPLEIGKDVETDDAATAAQWMEGMMAGAAAKEAPNQEVATEEKGIYTHGHVPIFLYKGHLWCRVSGQVYLDEGLEEFAWLAERVGGLCEGVRRG